VAAGIAFASRVTDVMNYRVRRRCTRECRPQMVMHDTIGCKLQKILANLSDFPLPYLTQGAKSPPQCVL